MNWKAAFYTLHAVLDPSGSTPPVTLRLAVHVPVGEMLEQVTEYIGVNPRHGRTGRRFPANAGITGKAFRGERGARGTSSKRRL